jgi:hypothetical protein
MIKNYEARHQWLISIILATWEAEIWRIAVQSQPRQIVRWRRHCFLSPSLVRASFLSHSWLLPNLTGLNWGPVEIQKRHRIDRQTESGARCAGCSGGDT